MEYSRVGQSGLVVSRASLGSWLTYGDSVDEKSSETIIQTAWENGITSFDTANAYNQGAAERVLGRALKHLPRTKLVVASKVFWPMGTGPNEKGLSRKAVLEQTHASLKRLDMEYLDILYLHRYDAQTPLYETLRAVEDLIRSGKVLYFGVSEWTARQITDAVHIADKRLFDRMIVSQPAYNLLRRDIEKEVLPVCEEYGIGQIVFSPLAQGMLTGKYRKGEQPPQGSRAASAQGQGLRQNYMTDENFEKVEAFRALCSELELPMEQAALAWILRNKAISSVILGASRPEQITNNLKALEVSLDQTALRRMDLIFG